MARAAIANHVQKIEMTPDGKTYVASGSWDLLGGGSGAVSMVPGDGIGPNVCPFDLVGWLAQRKLRALSRTSCSPAFLIVEG